MPLTMPLSDCAVRLAMTMPRWVLIDESAISDEVFCAASALRAARLRTSSATTAKPRPSSPARAASIAALSASRLVCAAMLSMVAMMPVMSLPALSISLMAVISSSINWLLCPASSREAWDCASALWALSAFSLVCAANWVITALISVIEDAELAAPWDSEWLSSETCSELAVMWVAPLCTSVISSLRLLTICCSALPSWSRSEDRVTSRSRSPVEIRSATRTWRCRLSDISFKACASSPTSSLDWCLSCWEKSPRRMFCAMAAALRIGAASLPATYQSTLNARRKMLAPTRICQMPFIWLRDLSSLSRAMA
ncbi:hypothetical protein D9M68_681430 [compost metagenome]